MNISVIIPTLNEAENVQRLVRHLYQNTDATLADIIVVDGGSKDNTVAKATAAGATVIRCDRCGRAYQMNKGSEAASGTLLYFVHCDTLPPHTYLEDIKKAVEEGFSIGCFRAHYDSTRFLLKFNSYFTRFDRLWCRGGDQTLFVTKSLFQQLGGYQSNLSIMEEYDFLIRARKNNIFKIIPSEVLVSTRKYDNRSFFRVQFANLIVFNMYRFGASQERMVSTYKWLLG